MKGISFSLEDFKDWLEAGEFQELPLTQQYEALRYRSLNGIGVVYSNDRNKRYALTGAAEKDFLEFEAQNRTSLGKDKRSRLRAHLEHRDGGPNCWFCASAPGTTIEHLLSRRWGGTNHKANLVLACEPCNQEADDLPVAQKVQLRERKRSHAV